MLRSDTVPFQQREERSGESRMVNDEMLRRGGGEILKEYCIKYLRKLRDFDNQVYQDFINLMKAFKPEGEGDDCIETLKQKVKDLLEAVEGRPDLILGFDAFLPKRQKINIPIPIKVQTARTVVLSRKRERDDSDVVDAESSDSKLQKVIDFVNKAKERLCKHDGEEGDNDFQSFLDIFSNNHSRRKRASWVHEDVIHKKVKNQLKDHPDLIDEFTHILPRPLPRLCEVITSGNFETCGLSYHVLPENFPIPATKSRSELASRVLNDRFVSVDPRPEHDEGEGEETKRRKLGWEDEFEEADRTMNIIGSVSLSIKALLERIEEDSPSEIYIEDHFMEQHLKYIKGLYDEQGLKAMDELGRNIRQALPVLLNRLKQQEEESKKKRQSLINQRRAHHMKVLSSR